ncbi:hypothetical protein [Aliiglaciecola lipolytica]|uniref:Uncharacterized protein n=1 Tax=Aliiglaciecola lipolytica E3 TaxID=1127673 RepID=K6XNX5_9ALTE|nr:hypothetical protein [Aliiglaciecola lipolytica]GAC13361.1 hypothetical protein GLIP_0715 [Aliiglaciecola lipolytica E3]
MKAIILSYDKQVGLAQLVVKTYLDLGVKCLDFLVPINHVHTKRKFEFASNIKCILSKCDILSSMESTLAQCDDDEWIYWAIDDRFPTHIDLSSFDCIYKAIDRGDFDFANGVKLINWREKLTGKKVNVEGMSFSLQESTSMFGFWHHQFLRAKVLKDTFFTCNEESYNDIRMINNSQHSKKSLSFLENIYVSDRNIVELEEPLWDGKLTRNGVEALLRFDCSVPEYQVVESRLGFKDFDEQLKLNPKRPKFF